MQKIITVALFFLFVSIHLIGQKSSDYKSPINWLTLEEADSLYKIQKRPIFIDVFTNWCGWCKRMDASTFKDPNVAAYLNTNFYPVKLNAETRDTITFNGKTYTNSQSAKVKKVINDLNKKITFLTDSINKLKLSKTESEKAITNSINQYSYQINNIKRKSRKTTHDVAIDLCRGQMSYPTFILLFNDLQANMPLKGFLKVPDLIGYLAFINEGAYRTTRDAGLFTELFKQIIKPDSTLQKEIVKWVSFETAIEKAKKDGKKILVHLINKNSISSNIMDKASYRDPFTAKKINKNFHAVKLNVNETNPIKYRDQVLKNVNGVHQLSIALMQNKISFPTHSFLDNNGNLIMRVPQFFAPKLIDPVLDYFIEEGYKTGNFGDWQKAKSKNVNLSPVKN